MMGMAGRANYNERVINKMMYEIAFFHVKQPLATYVHATRALERILWINEERRGRGEEPRVLDAALRDRVILARVFGAAVLWQPARNKHATKASKLTSG